RIDDALAARGRDREPVYQDKYGFRKIDVEQRFGRRELKNLSVLKEPREALLTKVKEPVAQRVGILLGRNRKERIPARAFRLPEHFGGDQIDVIAHNLAVTVRAKRAAGTRPQKTKEIVELGGGGDCRSRIPRRVFLANGDGRGDARDLIDIRLFH